MERQTNGPDGAATPQSGSARRAGSRRPFVIGFAISAALHLVAVALYPSFEAIVGSSFTPFTPPPSAATGTQVIQLVET